MECIKRIDVDQNNYMDGVLSSLGFSQKIYVYQKEKLLINSRIN